MKGFTIIELLITLAILTTISVFGGVGLFNYYSRQNLTSATDEIMAILRQARNSSITQENGDQWGVHFFNATTTRGLVQLFRGSDFSSSTMAFSQFLPTGVQFVNPASGDSLDVIFSKVTGYPNASTSIILSLATNSTASSTIVISAIGQVSKP